MASALVAAKAHLRGWHDRTLHVNPQHPIFQGDITKESSQRKQASGTHRCLDGQVHRRASSPGLEVPVCHHAAPQRHRAADKDHHRPEHVYEDRACPSGLLHNDKNQEKRTPAKARGANLANEIILPMQRRDGSLEGTVREKGGSSCGISVTSGPTTTTASTTATVMNTHKPRRKATYRTWWMTLWSFQSRLYGACAFISCPYNMLSSFQSISQSSSSNQESDW